MPPVNLDLHVGSIFKVLLISFPAYVICRIVYNIFLHPLRKFPGPFWHRASYLPFCYEQTKGTLPFDVSNYHEKYGPVVRIAPDQLSFIDAEAWKDICGHRTGLEEMSKSPKFYRNPGIPASITGESKQNHAVLRRHLAVGFSERSMRLQEPIIGGYVDLLMRRLRERCYEDGYSDDEKSGAAGGNRRRQAIDIKTWLNWTTFDIIGDLAFGEPFGCLENAAEHPWVEAVNDMPRVMGAMMCLKYLDLDWVLSLVLRLNLVRTRKDHVARTQAALDRRVNLSLERPDLIEGLLKIGNMEMDRLHTNASTLILAGSETTATLLAGVVYLLLSSPPDKLARLRDEVRGAFANEADITLTSVSGLTYMLACLDEALRRYPPVAGGLPRIVPAGGATIAGHFVPEKTTVAVWQLAAYQSEANFEDPLTFRPERFLHEDGQKTRDNFDVLKAFSFGPRDCIGKNLAYAEMRLILAKLLFNFDIELVDKDTNWLDHPVYVLRHKPALNVYLTPVAR